MNWDVVKGDWRQLSGKIKEQWSKLSDDEIEQVRGDRNQLAGKIQERYGVTEEEAHKQVDEWVSNH